MDKKTDLPEFDIEQELMDALTTELQQEIDRDILGVMSVSNIFTNLQNVCKQIYAARDLFESKEIVTFAAGIVNMSWDDDVYQQTNCSGYVETLTWDLDLLVSRLDNQDQFTYDMLGVK